ncbi:MAG: MoaD/ThiS family protein [Gammaproteobacteria bacterium]|jgi:molybdopterin synthase sulfur carrier subunit
MAIRVRYFASLREHMGRAEDAVEPERVATVEDVWKTVAGDVALPVNTLIAVNLEYADSAQQVADGDEVAFFPPVTGG